MNTKERLKKFIEHSNLTVSSFERLFSLSNGYVNSISKGIGNDKLEMMVEKFPSLNIEWLLIGKGDMLRESKPYTDKDKDIINSVNEPFPVYSFDFKELYLDAKYTIDIQKKYIVTLEKSTMVEPEKSNAG